MDDLEIRFARMEQRVNDHEQDLRALPALMTEHARYEERVAALNAKIDVSNRGIDEIKQTLQIREKENRANRLAMLVAAIGLLGTFLATLLPQVLGNTP